MWFRGKRDEEDEKVEDQQIERLVKHAAELHGVSTKEVVSTVLDKDLDNDDELEAELLDDEAERKWWRPGVWVTLVVVGVIFGVGIAGLMWLSHLATGPAASSGVEAFNASIAPTPTPNQTFQSPSLTFTYPGVFNVISTESNWPNTTERYMIASSSDYRRSISVMIEDNDSAPNNDSGFQYRSEAGSGYTATDVSVSGTPAIVMVKSDGTERTLYWEHADMLVVMSVVSTDGTDNLTKFMNVILGSLRWRTS